MAGARPAARPAPAAKPKDLHVAFIDSNPLVKVSADTASVVQQTVRLLSKAGAKVKRAEPKGLDWRQGWDDWADLFQYQVRALQPLAERERTFEMVNSSDPTARSVGRTARLDIGEFLAVLDRRDGIMRQCESFLDDYDAWLMPVMPDAAFIRQKQSEPLVIDGTPHPYFFAGTAYKFPRQPDGPALDRAALRLLQGGPADRPAAHRQEVGRRAPARRHQGAGEAPAALSGAAEL